MKRLLLKVLTFTVNFLKPFLSEMCTPELSRFWLFERKKRDCIE